MTLQDTFKHKFWMCYALNHKVFGLSIQMQQESLDLELNSRRTSGAKLRLFLETLAILEVVGQKIEFLVLQSYGLL